MRYERVILASQLLLIVILKFSCTNTTNGNKPGDYWLSMTESQRVSYLVGYSQGVDTGVDVSLHYKGSIYNMLLNSNKKQRSSILNRATELYKKNENSIIDWKSMLITAFSEINGESKDVVENRLLEMRILLEPHLGRKEKKPGDYWLLLPQKDRIIYLEALIDGIRTGILIEEQKDSELKFYYEGIFNSGLHIERIAEVVTKFYREQSNIIIEYRFIFPIAYMKFSKAKDSIIRKKLEKLRDKTLREN